MPTTSPMEALQLPAREDGALLWTTGPLDPSEAHRRGWSVYSLRQLREQFIEPARAAGLQRASLDNPAGSLLRMFSRGNRIAVVGVVTSTPADLAELYGYIIEPAYRAACTLLVVADRELHELDPAELTETVGYAWSLERLRYIASISRLAKSELDGQPPMTPIEAQLFEAMRRLGLAPVAQYGVKNLRVDFAFPDVRLGVECDGRPYHDPVADAKRDARLRRYGWQVIHFTGSEINRDAASCARRVITQVDELRPHQLSTAPEIMIGEHRSWWRRAWDALRRVLRPAQRETGTTVPPTDSDEPQWANPAPRSWTKDLDPEQRQAVEAHDGVVQVIAPAGSGKTTVLVARVRELLARGVPPNRILCLTFNTAAAAELNKRLHQFGVDAMEATTFHALGRRILKDANALPSDVGTLSYGQWRRLAKLAMDQTEDGIWIEAPDASDRISNLKLGQMLTVEAYSQLAESPDEKTLSTLYRLYQEELAAQDRCDFDDFIFEALRLLQRDSVTRRTWQQSFTAVLTDEYQDVEPAQELLLQIVAAPEDMLFCVGDEDQCLYAWRRATVERVIELDQRYPGLRRHGLARNYRCPSLVVDASRALIGHNRRRFPKRIDAVREDPGRITLVAATDLAAQADHAARLVAELGATQVAILARTSRVLSEVAVGLARAGIRFFGPERILRQRGEPAVLLAYIRLLGAPERAREEDVDVMFRVPNRYLPDGAALNVASALRNGLTFTRAIDRLQVKEAWRAKALADGASFFDRCTEVEGASELIHLLRSDGGLDHHYGNAERLNAADASDMDALGQAEAHAAGMSVSEYADALDYEAHIIEQHFDKKGVELATIHGAKGREWPVVIVVGIETDELPHQRSLANSDDPAGELEAERRLAYVAITRSAGRLVLMHQRDMPSQFLAEAAPVADRIDLGANDSMSPPPTSPGSSGDRQSQPGGRAPAPVTSSDGEVVILVGAPARNTDGTITCSVPGCDGWVAPGFVTETATGFVGLCPRQEHHQILAASSDAVRALVSELGVVEHRSKVEWARANRSGGSAVLADGEIVCGLPGCGGVVRPAFVVPTDEGPMGLCGIQARHEELVADDPALALRLAELEELQAALRPHSGRAHT